ncbi:hypothetical protein MTO96_048801 [Rhipicephalus appendiculatus]
MLESLGHGSRSVYEEDFERPFLAETARFYKSRCQNYLQAMDSFAYVARVKQHIDDESERARQCLNESTGVLVVQVLEAELIGECMEAVLEKVGSGVGYMIKNCMTEDLAHTFRLVNRVEGGMKAFLDCASKQLRNIGSSILREEGDSVSLMSRLIELKSRADHILRHSFNEDYSAEQAMATDFEHILSLTEKSPELLSAFVDDALRSGILRMTEQDIDSLVKNVAAIFAFLPDKDLFVSSYTQHLAKRLLACRDTSVRCRETRGRQAQDRVRMSIHPQAGNAIQRFAQLRCPHSGVQRGGVILQNGLEQSSPEYARADDGFLVPCLGPRSHVTSQPPRARLLRRSDGSTWPSTRAGN